MDQRGRPPPLPLAQSSTKGDELNNGSRGLGVSCWAATAVSHWDGFQEEAEKPLPLRSGPAPMAGTSAHHPQPLPSSGPAAVPFHAAEGMAPPPPQFSQSQGPCWEGLGAGARHGTRNGVKSVRTPGIAGCLLSSPARLFWCPWDVWPHFTDEQTEPWKGGVTSSKSHGL